MIDNLLEWSRYQTGRITLSPYPVRIHRVITESMSLLKVNAAEKNITFQNSVPDGTKAYVDARALSTVVRNLLCNAVKYSPEGETVHISVEEADDHINLSVADNGTGIASKDIDDLFKLDVDRRPYKIRYPEGLYIP